MAKSTLEELEVKITASIGDLQKKMQAVQKQVKDATAGVRESTARAQKQVESATGGIAASFGKLAKLAVFSVLAQKMLQVGTYSAQMALEVTASINQIKRQMGESSQTFLKWVESNASAMNMGIGEATKYGATFSNLFSGFIKDGDKLSAYTAKMLQSSAVIAEGTGRSVEDVMERIRSGLLGNTEAIEDLGINVNVAMIESTEAFKKFAGDRSWNQLDFQTQQQIRLMAILEQASAKYGDTLNGGVSSSLGLFKSLLKDVALNIGNALIPIIQAVMPVLNSMAMALRDATAKLAEFIALLFGKKATSKGSGGLSRAAANIDNVGKAASGATGAVDDLASAADDVASATDDMADNASDFADDTADTAGNLDKTAKAAKKAARELLGLMGFDEINVLSSAKKDDSDDSDPSSSKYKQPKIKSPKASKSKGGDGAGLEGADLLPDIELTDMENNFKSVFDGLGDKLKGLFDYFSKLKDQFAQGFKLSFREDGLDRIKTALAGIWDSIKSIFADGQVAQAAARFGEKLAKALGQTTGAIANTVLGLGVFITESLNKSLKETAPDIKGWLIRSFQNLGNIASSVGNIAQSLGQIFYDTITSTPATNIGANIISTLTYAGMGVGELGLKLGRDLMVGIETIIVENQGRVTQAFVGLLNALSPVFEQIKETAKMTFSDFNKMYDEHIKPFIDSFSQGISSLVGTLFDGWNKQIQPVLDSLGKKLAEVLGSTTQGLIKAISGAIGAFFDMLKSFWEQTLMPLFSWIASNIMPALAPVIEAVGTTLVDALKGTIEILTIFFDGAKEVFTYLSENTAVLNTLVTVIGSFTAAWKAIEWMSWVQQAGGLNGALTTMLEGLRKVKTAIAAVTVAKIADMVETAKLHLMYAGDFLKSIGPFIVEKGKELALWIATTAAKIAETAATVAMTVATWALNAALAVLTSPITLVIVAITALVAIGVALYKNWDEVTAFAKEAWKSVCDYLKEVCEKIGKWFADLWDKTKKIFDPVSNWFKSVFEKAYQFILDAFSGMANWAKNTWDGVKKVFEPVSKWFGQQFGQAYQAITGAFQNISSFFNGIINNIKRIFGNIGNTVSESITGTIKSAINGLLRNAANSINGFIGIFNGAIDLLNQVPGVNIKYYMNELSVPYLARGGIVSSPTLAMIGEAGKEAVVPLENTGFLQTMGEVVASAVVSALANANVGGGGASDRPLELNLNIGSERLGRVVINSINRAQEQAGTLLLDI